MLAQYSDGVVALVGMALWLLSSVAPRNPNGLEAPLRGRSRSRFDKGSKHFTSLIYSRKGDGTGLRIGHRGQIRIDTASSLLVVGPTRSGKTHGVVIPAICSWGGSVVVTSVKSDVLQATLAQRHAMSRSLVVGGGHGGRAAVWDPSIECVDATSSRKMARLFVSHANGYATSSGDARFWFHLSEPVIAGIFRIGHSQGGMEALAPLLDLRSPLALAELLLQLGEDGLARALSSVDSEDSRHVSSIFLTSFEILQPLLEAAEFFGEAQGTGLGDFCFSEDRSGSFSLYLCAPLQLQRRLSPYFAALISFVLDGYLEENARHCRNERLLVVLDEAANIAPVADLAEFASVGSSLGVQLVSVFQDLSQMRERYGSRTGTIVNNHRSKLLLGGITDMETLQLADTLMGGIENNSVEGLGRWRRITPGEGWLVQGTRQAQRVRLRQPRVLRFVSDAVSLARQNLKTRR